MKRKKRKKRKIHSFPSHNHNTSTVSLRPSASCFCSTTRQSRTCKTRWSSRLWRHKSHRTWRRKASAALRKCSPRCCCSQTSDWSTSWLQPRFLCKALWRLSRIWTHKGIIKQMQIQETEEMAKHKRKIMRKEKKHQINCHTTLSRFPLWCSHRPLRSAASARSVLASRRESPRRTSRWQRSTPLPSTGRVLRCSWRPL